MKLHHVVQSICALAALILLVIVVQAQGPPPLPPPPPSTSLPTAPSGVNVTTGKRGVITGRVVGEDGQPLEGVVVMAAAMNGDRIANGTAMTDDDGNFRLSDLPAAAYIVQASVPGLVNAQGNMLEIMTMSSTPRHRIGESVTITMIKGGAMTGKVLDAAGRPLVGAAVWVVRVRDAEGRTVNEAIASGRPGMTDDRGVYRLYGLAGGSYVVYTNAGGAGEMFSSLIGASEAPTYFPNATRDTAQEVSVSPGLEVQGIDIRHRGDLGHAVSGTLVGVAENVASGMQVTVVELLHAATGSRVGASNINMSSGSGFAIYGIPDGDYEINALQRIVSVGQRMAADGLAATPRRISVRGSDVTGIELKLVPLASIAGRAVLEPFAADPKTCQITRRGDLEEVLFLPRREDKEVRRSSLLLNMQDATPNDKGEFIARDLDPGRYRLTAQLPSDHWYLKTMSLGSAPTAKPAAPARTAARTTAPNIVASGITLKSSEKLSGLTVTIAEGAAGLSGRVEGQKLPKRVRVHLVPAEAEAASDVLRYHEVVTRDGAFALQHLAPGKYWLLARAVADEESDETPAKPAAWDANERAKLRREAEAGNQALTLTPCQRAKDFVLKFGATMK